MALCSFYGFYPGFLDLVAGMGYKPAPSDEHFMACYSHLRPNLGDTIVTTAGMFSSGDGDPQSEAVTDSHLVPDLCYNVQYFEKHGRNLEDPWSCRQSVIYHKYDMAKNCSIWVTVQPPDTWESSLKDLCHHRLSHPLFMHLRFIRSAAANFRDYLNYISSKLLDLVRARGDPSMPCLKLAILATTETGRTNVWHFLSRLQSSISTSRLIKNFMGCVGSCTELKRF